MIYVNPRTMPIDLHALGVAENSKDSIEGVDPRFIREGALRIQKQAWNFLHQVRTELKEGMTELQARDLALEMAKDLRITKHWHRPYIRLGKGTTLSFHDGIQSDYQLQWGDPFYIDLGPVWKDEITGIEYESDVGETFVYGSNSEAEQCAATAKKLFYEAQTEWNQKGLSGIEIYDFLKNRASSLNYVLVEKVDGHRLGDFPHQKYSKERLAQLQFKPSPILWVLEVQINHPRLPLGAFYEDLLNLA